MRTISRAWKISCFCRASRAWSGDLPLPVVERLYNIFSSTLSAEQGWRTRPYKDTLLHHLKQLSVPYLKASLDTTVIQIIWMSKNIRDHTKKREGEQRKEHGKLYQHLENQKYDTQPSFITGFLCNPGIISQNTIGTNHCESLIRKISEMTGS